MEKHPIEECFTVRDVLTSIMRGSIIENYDRDGRCLISGDVPGLALSKLYVSNYIHSVIKWDDPKQIIVITKYRPSSTQWINHFRRRE